MNTLSPLSARAPGVLVAFCLFLGLTTSSFASGTVLVVTSIDEEAPELLTNNAAASLHRAGVGVASIEDAELAGFSSERTVRCIDADEDCAELLGRAPAEWVLLLRTRRNEEGIDADLRVIAKLFSASDGSLLQVEQRICERCSSKERLARVVVDLIAEVADSELAHRASETYLSVRSTPHDGILSIDGAVVGPTGQVYRVSPGEHQIEVQRRGYRSTVQRVSVGANEHKALSMTLAREKSDDAGGGTRSYLAWLSIASGAIALGGGIGWLTVDGDLQTSAGSRASVTDSKALGISSLAAGTVLTGVGVALLLTTGDANDELQVTAAPTGNGVSLGLSGHF